MALRDRLLPIVERIRGRIPGGAGLRYYRVFLRTKAFTYHRVGQGAATQDETELLVGGYPPKVVEVSDKYTVGGAPEYNQTTYEVGPITPPFPGSTVTEALLGPEYAGDPKQIHFRLTGPGIPVAGILCQLEGGDSYKPFRRMLRLVTIGRKAT